jgi:hypothetical protein
MNLVDPARSAQLCDVGQSDYMLVTAVSDDGTVDYVLAERASINTDSGYDSTCRDAVHERVGPLPYYWQSRVTLAPFYCGRRTLRGTRCRIPVSQAGDTCAWHRTTQRSSTT